MTPLTTHARVRMRQRGLAMGHLDLLLNYGTARHDHHGAEIYLFDKAALRRLERDWGRSLVSKLDSLPGSYAVVSDGCVVTTGHRRRRLLRH